MKMKKISKKVLSLLVVFALACSLVPAFTYEAQALVTQDESEDHYYTLSLKVGGTTTLTTTLGSSTGAYGWYTYDSSVVEITSSSYNNSCSFKAVGTGTTTIKAVTKVYDTLALNYYCYDYWTVTVTKSSSSSGTTSGGSSSSGTKKIAPSSITFNKSSVNIKRGKSKKLKYTISPSNANTKKKVTFTSSNTKVATVNKKGKVTAKKVGTATITVKTANGKTDTCTVNVTRPDPTSVSLNKKKTTLIVGKTTKLKASVTPGDAKKKLKWTSSNKKVATVNANGKIKAKKAGTTKITVRTSNGKTATCRVTVKDINAKKIKLSKKKLSLIKGKTAKLTYKLIPSNATNTVKWTSSNKKVATVNKKGKVRAKSGGTAKITATTSNGKKAVCKVTVKVPITGVSLNKTLSTINVGNTTTLSATIKPSDTTGSKKLTWSSSNSSVASVNSSGKVTAKAPGTAAITVKTSNGKKATCKITVKAPITGVTLNKSSATLYMGSTLTLSATIAPSNTTSSKTLTWSSSNTSAATVSSSGVVTPVSPGTAVITVSTVNGKTAACTVTVADVDAAGISFSADTIEVDKADASTIDLSDYCVLTPSNATSSVTWESSDTSVLKQDSGSVFTLASAGTATVTATTSTGYTASCTVIVSYSIKSVTLSSSAVSIDVDETTELTATISPYLSSVTTDATLYWTSSDTSVVAVQDTSMIDGVYPIYWGSSYLCQSTVTLYPQSAGTATITVASANGRSASCSVTVSGSSDTGGSDTDSCGSDLDWILADGVLTISGEGDMYDLGVIGTPWYSMRESVEKVVIEDGVTSIGDGAFSYCTNLTDVVIADSVKSIGQYAFRNCLALESVEIGSGVEDIAYGAFYYCQSLGSITIPDSATEIGAYAFWLNTDLASVDLGSNVETIGEAAFYGCKSLKSIIIPDSVKSVGRYVFTSCKSLESAYIGSSLETLTYDMFGYCTNLENVTISGAITISGYAFLWCTSLESIEIPASAESVEPLAFNYCTSLTYISVAEDSAYFSSLNGIMYDKTQTTLVCCPGGLTSVSISDSVTTIGTYAFANCNELTDVYYAGSEDDWSAVTIESGNTKLTNAAIHYNSTGDTSE